jgi:hypothetical protein
MNATVTIRVNREDITVELVRNSSDEWIVVEAIDEDGEKFPLDEDETNTAIYLAEQGVDETGR